MAGQVRPARQRQLGVAVDSIGVCPLGTYVSRSFNAQSGAYYSTCEACADECATCSQALTLAPAPALALPLALPKASYPYP